MEKITILLVDDHRLIRDSWSHVLNMEPRFQVVGAASTGDEAIKMAKAKRHRVILMDINMMPVNGFDTTKAIRKHAPGPRIIGVSMYTIPVYTKKCFRQVPSDMLQKIHQGKDLLPLYWK